MTSPQALGFWRAMRDAPQQIALPLAARREAGERAEDATSEPAGVAFRPAPEVGGLWAEPEGSASGAGVLYLFGGGYVLGSPASRRKTAGHLAAASGAAVLVANYRLAPEHPFPAALDDAVAAYRVLLGHGFAADRAVIAGDSAGGGLAVACALALRGRGAPQPAGVLAFSPWADLTCSGASMADNAARDIECTRAGLLGMAASYLAGHAPRDPLASPVFGRFDGVKALLCVVGGDEVLLDDSLRLARAAALGGADARVHVAPGMQHVFPVWCGAFPEADAEMARAGAWIKEMTRA